MKQILYFAYGSNLLSSRLIGRIGSADVHSNYRLQNYKLVFNCNQYANIIPFRGEHVDGTLYHITPAQLSELNRYEALYNTYFFEHDEYIVAVYVGKDYVTRSNENPLELLPNRDYIDIIIRGALEKQLFPLAEYLLEMRERIPVYVKPIYPKRQAQRKSKKVKRRR